MPRPTPSVAMLLLALLSPAGLAAAQTATTTASSSASSSTATAAPSIYNASSTYAYYGCYNETMGLAGTNGLRTLSGGADEVGPGNMTAPACLAFCAGGAPGGPYQFAGLEFARECWCAQHVSSLAARLADAACDLGCQGDPSQACGGSLKITVYMLSGASSMRAASGLLALVVAAAVGFGLL